jgi:hypothetical protein
MGDISIGRDREKPKKASMNTWEGVFRAMGCDVPGEADNSQISEFTEAQLAAYDKIAEAYAAKEQSEAYKKRKAE